ncbi:unnamed protein product [Leptosia nina]|uniref:Odorant receptor n=1 Tax=Leptosia nina TaxID=320188 RepID=A0AAV1JEQ9_9NEOP
MPLTAFLGGPMKFKSFNETYTLLTLLLTMCMMYPNPQNDRKRALGIVLLSVLLIPQLVIIVWDIYMRILLTDLNNGIRQLVMILCLSFIIFKMVITLIWSGKFKRLLDKLNTDLNSFNDLPKDYQRIAARGVARSQKLEKMWTVVLIIAVSTFPFVALGLTIYSQFTKEPRKYMIHEAFIPMIEDVKYESPYFEIYTVYNIFMVWIVCCGYAGYDATFYVIVLHVSLKIKLFVPKITNLMADSDVLTMRAKIGEIVRDQCSVYDFLKEIQSCFELWLASMFFILMCQIAMGLCQLNVAGENRLSYFMFAAAVSINLFLPCYVVSDLTSTAASVSDYIYGCGWDLVPNPGVRKSVAFMIARAQIPLNITPYDMFTCNMETFVSVCIEYS